jgi:hypothetical protein
MDYDDSEEFADLELREEIRELVRSSRDLSADDEMTWEEAEEVDQNGGIPPNEEPPVTPALPSEGDGQVSGRPPVSERKLAANRANAKRSTGPTTPEGKEKSRRNAVKHGLTARFFLSILQESVPEWSEFSKIILALTEHFQPVGPIEELLVEKIAIETIRFRRFIAGEQNDGFYWEEVLRRGGRYQSAINRQLFEAMRELERLQKNRKKENDAE